MGLTCRRVYTHSYAALYNKVAYKDGRYFKVIMPQGLVNDYKTVKSIFVLIS